MMSVLKVLCCLLVVYQLNEAKKIKGHRAHVVAEELNGVQKEPHVSLSTFRLFAEGEDNCTVEPLQLHTLTSCGFNSSNPLIIITHGWSVDGIMESWVLKLATALKSNLIDVNVVITDWLSLAQTHYATAAKHTRSVGKDIAHLLQALQVHYQYPPKKVHLIGYSLGAHISGFAGSYLEGPEKIGRITGLDPAGPLFEGMPPSERLSPDDADFVDAIHTFTQESMGLSVGIKQAVGHYDFYPNGGDSQPGCDLRNIYGHISEYGLLGFEQTFKCAHERSVHLFIDSLLNKDKQNMAYRCRDMSSFDQGVCLDCRRHHCNTLGYNINKFRAGRSKQLYLKTRSQMPYKLYHYQFRIQFVNQMEQIQPSLTISVTGTKEESGDIPITITEPIFGNTSLTSLITLDRDLGDLMFLKLRWEGAALWKSMQNWVKTMIPWGGPERQALTVGKISIKAGETQERTTFCAVTHDEQQVEIAQEKVFVRCKEDSEQQHKRKRN